LYAVTRGLPGAQADSEQARAAQSCRMC
jgi:hypothetical protein